MKTILTSILLVTICEFVTYGQNSKYDFAKDVFRREYKKKDFEKFDGKVEEINENTFRDRDKRPRSGIERKRKTKNQMW